MRNSQASLPAKFHSKQRPSDASSSLCWSDSMALSGRMKVILCWSLEVDIEVLCRLNQDERLALTLTLLRIFYPQTFHRLLSVCLSMPFTPSRGASHDSSTAFFFCFGLFSLIHATRGAVCQQARQEMCVCGCVCDRWTHIPRQMFSGRWDWKYAALVCNDNRKPP